MAGFEIFDGGLNEEAQERMFELVWQFMGDEYDAGFKRQEPAGAEKIKKIVYHINQIAMDEGTWTPKPEGS